MSDNNAEQVGSALTPGEWGDPADVFDGYIDLRAGIVDVRLGGPGGARDPQREARALAALLLQFAGPEGGPLLTWEMVRDLDVSAECQRNLSGADSYDYRSLKRLAALLASLLPPETKP